MSSINFSHPTTSRTAVVDEEPAANSVTVQYVDKADTWRQKTFKSRAKHQAMLKARTTASQFLFTEGFHVRAPQKGAIQWMLQTQVHRQGLYPIASAGDTVWVSDVGFLRSVAAGTCEVHEHSMPRPFALSASPTSTAVLVNRPGSGCRRIARLVEGALVDVADVPWPIENSAVESISVALDGRFLGPTESGAGLFDAAGASINEWPAARGQHYSAKAAISGSGEWVAITTKDGLRVEGPASFTGPRFTDVLNLTVDDDGCAWVGGIMEDRWGLYRSDADGTRCVSEGVWAVPTLDRKSLVECTRDDVVQRTLDGRIERQATLPWLCMEKHGHLNILGGTLVVRTRTRLAGIDLASLS